MHKRWENSKILKKLYWAPLNSIKVSYGELFCFISFWSHLNLECVRKKMWHSRRKHKWKNRPSAYLKISTNKIRMKSKYCDQVLFWQWSVPSIKNFLFSTWFFVLPYNWGRAREKKNFQNTTWSQNFNWYFYRLRFLNLAFFHIYVFVGI